LNFAVQRLEEQTTAALAAGDAAAAARAAVEGTAPLRVVNGKCTRMKETCYLIW
jgi:hypothetical protein